MARLRIRGRGNREGIIVESIGGGPPFREEFTQRPTPPRFIRIDLSDGTVLRAFYMEDVWRIDRGQEGNAEFEHEMAVPETGQTTDVVVIDGDVSVVNIEIDSSLVAPAPVIPPHDPDMTDPNVPPPTEGGGDEFDLPPGQGGDDDDDE